MSSRNTAERDASDKNPKTSSWTSKLLHRRSDSRGTGTNEQPSGQATSASDFLSADSANETAQSLVPTGYRSDVETVITAGGFDESVLNIPKVKPVGTWKDFVVSLIEENLGEDPLHSAYTFRIEWGPESKGEPYSQLPSYPKGMVLYPGKVARYSLQPSEPGKNATENLDHSASGPLHLTDEMFAMLEKTSTEEAIDVRIKNVDVFMFTEKPRDPQELLETMDGTLTKKATKQRLHVTFAHNWNPVHRDLFESDEITKTLKGKGPLQS
ncbi:hypothetical protein HD553DRAFT_337966 [Filobasidium floriforme]|uniref:uncharacterized protein n=1 Tax=Filobasidium floriforme TaxID=5210 RepID=UPI001E8EA0E1|nr:uncharacterized protein HD553DRAFT_337966 [Filobasidium floriforme]KAH8090278.1 hypothetical protein HD553DRAFT_337966 [Filobasidium floriforme]